MLNSRSLRPQQSLVARSHGTRRYNYTRYLRNVSNVFFTKFAFYRILWRVFAKRAKCSASALLREGLGLLLRLKKRDEDGVGEHEALGR